ncbi:MAG: rRNA maturation RNase YbeY [Gammaproteobacteria bacterium]|nr:rRNA maturation RNase YbeY [Gammaproteobacteria bacterium]
MGAQINLQRRVPPAGIPSAAALRAWAQAAMDGTAGELTLRIVDETESARLNGRFRNRPDPTNVLSFAYDAEPLQGAGSGDLLGDVVICAPLVAREARAQRKPPRAHWAHLVVHGVLHLLGHDHLDPADAQRMEAREREILATLGFADPYR